MDAQFQTAAYVHGATVIVLFQGRERVEVGLFSALKGVVGVQVHLLRDVLRHVHVVRGENTGTAVDCSAPPVLVHPLGDGHDVALAELQLAGLLTMEVERRLHFEGLQEKRRSVAFRTRS